MPVKKRLYVRTGDAVKAKLVAMKDIGEEVKSGVYEANFNYHQTEVLRICSQRLGLY